MKRTPFRRTTPMTRAAASKPLAPAKDAPKAASIRVAGVPARRRAPIPQRSVRRVVEERIYNRLRREFLAGAECARCGTTQGLTVQHLAGRVGARYLDMTLWLAMCWRCHALCENAPLYAKAHGWALSKIGVLGA